MKIRFWNLPENRNYIKIEKKFGRKLASKLNPSKYRWRIRNNIKHRKISIKKIKEISEKENMPLEKIEEKIIWIGGNNSKGLTNPKFPISFNFRAGGRFVAAIINDGTLTMKNNSTSYGRLMYDNYDASLRKSVIKDYLKIFGGSKKEIAFRNYKRKKYLEFSSVVRDIVHITIKEKGPKTKSNLDVPKFVMKNKEAMKGWIEQTIGDEGEVKFYPQKYRRAIVWRRSLDITKIMNNTPKKRKGFRSLKKDLQKAVKKKKCLLIEGEKKMLEKLGIDYNIYILGVYPTSKRKMRMRIQIMITKRKNLLNLRELIEIPSSKKDKKFTKLVESYERYKEVKNIRDSIISLGKEKKEFTSKDLQKKMNYSTLNTANKWLRKFEGKLIEKMKKATYGGKKRRNYAKYELL